MIKLIVGLNNPGAQYQHTRHNAGAWFCEQFAHKLGFSSFKLEKKMHCELSRYQGELNSKSNSQSKSIDIRMALPNTFMNLSGQAVQSLMGFYKLKPESILIIHDELDIPPGQIKLKQGGGHAGHNGLRDIAQRIGRDFLRLRIGIGRPDHPGPVTNYVLGRPSIEERLLIENAISKVIDSPAMEQLCLGAYNKAIQTVNSL